MSTTVRYTRRSAADATRRSPAARRGNRPTSHGSRCRCVRTDGTSPTNLRRLAPLRDGVEGIID